MPLFFFPCRIHGTKGKPREGQKTPCKRLFFLGNLAPYPQRRTLQKWSIFQATTPNGNEGNGAKTHTGRKQARKSPTNRKPHRQHHQRHKRPENARKMATEETPTERPRRQGESDHGRSAARIATERGRRNLSASPRAHAPTREICCKTVARGFFHAHNERSPKLQAALFVGQFCRLTITLPIQRNTRYLLTA